MLYMIFKKNSMDLSYNDGQDSIIHLEFNLNDVIKWAKQNNKRWVITDINAGCSYFNDSNKIEFLNTLNWSAINSKFWQKCKEEKQAEFLIEEQIPFKLIKRIGVFNKENYNKVKEKINKNIKIEICKD